MSWAIFNLWLTYPFKYGVVFNTLILHVSIWVKPLVHIWLFSPYKSTKCFVRLTPRLL